MNRHAIETMQARVRALKSRAAVRRWNYRQRHLAAGVWFRLRRALADARRAYVISAEDARQLIAEGYRCEACGLDLVPEKTLLFVDEARLAEVEPRRPIDVALDAEFLVARHIALVAFDGVRNKIQSNP